MAKIVYPEFAKHRGIGYWLRPANLWASRRKFLRTDSSIAWRKTHTAALAPKSSDHLNADASFSTPFTSLLNPDSGNADSYRFVIMGDTGEGDRSQYALVPLLRGLAPEFILIAGDIVYPIGKTGPDRDSDDYLAGVFEPYANLRIPIWGVPGNHEYYCKEKGKGFFEVFCGSTYAGRWDNYGLRLVRQPGAFWELRQPGRREDLVVLGLDTGLHGNLDGHHSWWQFWKKREKPDHQQLGWFQERLDHAQRNNCKVIVMFHIPSLVDQVHRGDAHLKIIHKLIAGFSCVKLVVVGHIHNFQAYTPDVLALYLKREYDAVIRNNGPLHYMVCGGGGAYLTSTDFKHSHYPCQAYPSRDTWKKESGFWRRAVEKSGLGRTAIGRVVSVMEKGALADADLPAYLSVLLVEVTRKNNRSEVRITPVYLDDVGDLFAHLPEEQVVSVLDQNPPISVEALKRCMQPSIIL